MGIRSYGISAIAAAVLFQFSVASPAEASACTVSTARQASSSPEILCECDAVTSDMIKYIQRRADFSNYLTRTGAECPKLAALLSDLPTASIGLSEQRSGEGPPDERPNDPEPDDQPDPNDDPDPKPDPKENENEACECSIPDDYADKLRDIVEQNTVGEIDEEAFNKLLEQIEKKKGLQRNKRTKNSTQSQQRVDNYDNEQRSSAKERKAERLREDDIGR